MMTVSNILDRFTAMMCVPRKTYIGDLEVMYLPEGETDPNKAVGISGVYSMINEDTGNGIVVLTEGHNIMTCEEDDEAWMDEETGSRED